MCMHVYMKMRVYARTCARILETTSYRMVSVSAPETKNAFLKMKNT